MGMVVQHNMNALTAYNKLNANVAGLKKSSEKLASGYRINRAGDDAAGLAISEKMRSQIKGLNQAIRNSQDGINMVQTFEGAAQETHSILQRMKELATESANGTYDNATDRAAIQLEFDQLNDELNQIADTDFNGTVVLNGGVMADGTVAKNGEFDYASGYTETVVGAKATDLSGGKAEHTLVDQTMYNKTKADAVYDAVKVNVKDIADEKTGNSTINVTFMYDGERWVADTVTNDKGEVIEGARAAGLEARPVDRTDASGKGGFEVIAGKDPYTGKDIIATNVIFNEMDKPVKKGDTVTVSFDNTMNETYAPKNCGVDEESFEITASTTAGDHLVKDDVIDHVHFELDKGITDETMTDAIKTSLDKVKKASFVAKYEDGKMTGITKDGTTAFTTADDGFKIAVVDGVGTITDANDVVLGKITFDNVMTMQQKADAKATATTDTKYTGFDSEAFVKALGADVPAEGKGDLTVTITVKNDTGAGAKGFQISYTPDGAAAATTKKVDGDWAAKNDVLAGWGITTDSNQIGNGDTFTVTVSAPKSAKEIVDTKAEGTVKFGLNIEAYNVVDLNTLNVHAVATPKVATMASQVATPGVTQANAFKNSTARMTYTDNITLQTGARTKDAVNFNFSYNTDGSADMGDLVANLDLSARSTGLNTANLSLASQDDANYAIDQIDKAINKTSMVRATFGSIQNRLEHKITNLTTTAENLTEAESSIRDTDMANEMMNYTKFNILQQAAQSMLAQANQQPQSILQLLG